MQRWVAPHAATLFPREAQPGIVPVGDLPIGEQPMPDYRISQPQLLRLALLASGGDTPKFDEVFGIIREARPILDPDTVSTLAQNEKRIAEAVAGRPLTGADVRSGGISGDRFSTMSGLPPVQPLGAAPLPPVTGDEPNATGTLGSTADAEVPPAKPE